jgi:hypothetical protein
MLCGDAQWINFAGSAILLEEASTDGYAALPIDRRFCVAPMMDGVV